MAWEKLGMVFDVHEYDIAWLRSHAMLPAPLLLSDRLRVYFTGRDEHKHSRISFVDLDRGDPTRILYIHDRPLLKVGKLGMFDDSGTMGTCAVVGKDDTVLLYYNGYMQTVTVPWRNAIGVAVSFDRGVTFSRVFDGPIVDRTPEEPYFVISGKVMYDDGMWKMWYASGVGWILVDGVPEGLYVIKYTQSADGLDWIRRNVMCIEPLSPEEANASAAVARENDGSYRMWFCHRGSRDFRDGADSYRIGYAESEDGVNWLRDDERAGIDLGGDGDWDSLMMAYPSVVNVGSDRYLFYNGNSFGRDGFGCAIWH